MRSASWTRSAQGFDVSTLTRDVSSKTDLVTALDAYEGTLIKLTGTVNADFTSAGGQHVAAAALTAGITSGTGVKLRLPTALRDSIDAVRTCGFVLNQVPLWRNVATAQPSAWVAADVTLSACPAPQLVSAVATDASTVRATFDRNIKATSFDSTGAQLTFNNGLTAASATLAGRVVTAKITPDQTPAAAYTLTVASSLTDLLDKPIDAAHLTSNFSGYVVPAQVVFNEINPSVTAKHDLDRAAGRERRRHRQDHHPAGLRRADRPGDVAVPPGRGRRSDRRPHRAPVGQHHERDHLEDQLPGGVRLL